MVHWNSSDSCTHEDLEESVVVVYDQNDEEVEKIPVERCSECEEIQSVIDSEDNRYQLPREPNDCDHPHEGVEVIRYNFRFEDGTSIWSTVTRLCTKCDILIERVKVDLTEKP